MSDSRTSETRYPRLFASLHAFTADFWCPSCRKFMPRECRPNQRVLKQRCENAGRVVRMVRRSGT